MSHRRRYGYGKGILGHSGPQRARWASSGRSHGPVILRTYPYAAHGGAGPAPGGLQGRQGSAEHPEECQGLTVTLNGKARELGFSADVLPPITLVEQAQEEQAQEQAQQEPRQ